MHIKYRNSKLVVPNGFKVCRSGSPDLLYVVFYNIQSTSSKRINALRSIGVSLIHKSFQAETAMRPRVDDTK